MITFGTYKIPPQSLDRAIELAQVMATTFNGYTTRKDLANALNMSERGGAFAAQLGALRSWRLVTGRSDIELTTAGIALTAPKSETETKTALRHIGDHHTLFTAIFERTDGEIPDQLRLQAIIKEVSGATYQEVQQNIQLIERCLRVLQPAFDETEHNYHSREGIFTSQSKEPQVVPHETGLLNIKFPGAELHMPETATTIEAATLVLLERLRMLTDDEQVYALCTRAVQKFAPDK